MPLDFYCFLHLSNTGYHYDYFSILCIYRSRSIKIYINFIFLNKKRNTSVAKNVIYFFTLSYLRWYVVVYSGYILKCRYFVKTTSLSLHSSNHRHQNKIQGKVTFYNSLCPYSSQLRLRDFFKTAQRQFLKLMTKLKVWWTQVL